MIDPDLLRILCCPETHQELSLAGTEQVQELNRRIQAGSVHNRAGQVVKEAIDGGLVRADGQFVYPIRGRIPILLVDEAIPLAG